MIALQLMAWAVVLYAIARGLDWLQAQIPDNCDVFRAMQDEWLRIEDEGRGPE